MKRFYLALAGLLLLAMSIPADAAWNIRQKGSGGTVWTDGSVEVPVGSNGVLVPVSSFQSSLTFFVPIYKSGNVVRTYIVNNRGWSGSVANPTVALSVSPASAVVYTPISISASSATFTIATNGMQAAGTLTYAVYPVTGQRIRQGEVLRIIYTGPSHGGLIDNGMREGGAFNVVIE
jgi:hypothetical protein